MVARWVGDEGVYYIVIYSIASGLDLLAFSRLCRGVLLAIVRRSAANLNTSKMNGCRYIPCAYRGDVQRLLLSGREEES